jgi:HlyD family secretion protein
VLAIPIQALTIRTSAQLEQQKSSSGSVQAASPAPKETSLKDQKKDEGIQGVFVIRNRKAEFVPVTTGVTGTTDIEVLQGLKEGDEIITGSYKILRTLRPGHGVKVDNSAPKKEDETT